MADDNKPQHLDPSDHSGDETTTHHRTTTDETRALPEISDDGTQSTQARHENGVTGAETSQPEPVEPAQQQAEDPAADDATADEPVTDVQPAETVTEEVDPETRMLQQIAALKSGDETADGTAVQEPVEQRSAAEVEAENSAVEDAASSDASQDDVQDQAIPHTKPPSSQTRPKRCHRSRWPQQADRPVHPMSRLTRRARKNAAGPGYC